MTNITKTSEKDTTKTTQEKAQTTKKPISYKISEKEDLAMSLFYK